MFCENCGTKLPEKSKFCSGCGTKTEVQPVYTTAVRQPTTPLQPVPPAPPIPPPPPAAVYSSPTAPPPPPAAVYSSPSAPPVPRQSFATPAYGAQTQLYHDPLSLGQYIVMFLLMFVPILNIIMLFVWSFGRESNLNKKNFAKASLILSAVMLLFYTIAGGIIVSVLSGLMGGYY